MSIELRKDYKYSIIVPTSMGIRITPVNGQPVHCSETFYMQATSAESNVASVSSYLGLPVKVLTCFVKDSPFAQFIKNNLASRHMDYEAKEIEQGGPWGYRHQINFADSGYGSRGPRVYNDRAGEIGRTLLQQPQPDVENPPRHGDDLAQVVDPVVERVVRQPRLLEGLVVLGTTDVGVLPNLVEVDLVRLDQQRHRALAEPRDLLERRVRARAHRLVADHRHEFTAGQDRITHLFAVHKLAARKVRRGVQRRISQQGTPWARG